MAVTIILTLQTVYHRGYITTYWASSTIMMLHTTYTEGTAQSLVKVLSSFFSAFAVLSATIREWNPRVQVQLRLDADNGLPFEGFFAIVAIMSQYQTVALRFFVDMMKAVGTAIFDLKVESNQLIAQWLF